MRQTDPSDGLVARLAAIAVAASLMVGGIVVIDRAVAADAKEMEPTVAARIISSPQPIAEEADVFRAGAAVMELQLSRRAAHPRTLATYRALRAYPGAPPRVPHGLTAEELRTSSCRTCHERGGYAQRFGAYAPVTPHPEYTECLQCHVPDDALLGIPLPDRGAGVGCRQCHVAPGAATPLVDLDWQPARWPAVTATSDDSAPPPIPHELQLRGNCIACHAGAGAVAEIRTTHPERTDCRQCHVSADADAPPFVRPNAGGQQ